MAKGGAASTANVVIKLKIHGHENVAAQLKALDTKLGLLEKKYNGIAGKFDNIAQAFERHEKSLERHNKLIEDNGASIELWNESLKNHRAEHVETRKSWGESDKALRGLKGAINEARTELNDFDKDVKRVHNKTLIDFDKELHRKREDFEKLSKAMKDTDKELNRFEGSAKKAGRALTNKDNDFGKVLKRFFEPGIKLMKFAGIEFAVLTAAVGGLQGALWLGQITMKAFNAALTGLGAAAGYALGGLSTLLAAQRQLATVKMAPLLSSVGGPYSAASKMAGTIGSPELAQFSKAVPMIVQSAAEKGQGGGAGLTSMLKILGDVAITAKDPNKALSDLASTFLEVQQSGKFSRDSLAKLKEQFPAMAKGVEEFRKKNGSAKFSVDEFFAAFQKGEIQALKPFIGTLDKVNDTLIGRFKSSITTIKEQFIEMGMPLVDLFKKPLANLQREMTIFISKISYPVQLAFERIFGSGEGTFMGRVLDKLATLIITSLNKVEGFVERLRNGIFRVKEFFGDMGESMRKASRSWGLLYEKILKPLGSEIWKTIAYAVEQFNRTMEKTSSYSDGMAGTFAEIFDIVRKLIKGFADLKEALAPIITSFMTFIKIAGNFMKALGPVGPALAALGITSKIMGGGKGIFKIGKAGKAGAAGADGGAGAMGKAFGAANFMLQPFSMFGLMNRWRRPGMGRGPGVSAAPSVMDDITDDDIYAGMGAGYVNPFPDDDDNRQPARRPMTFAERMRYRREMKAEGGENWRRHVPLGDTARNSYATEMDEQRQLRAQQRAQRRGRRGALFSFGGGGVSDSIDQERQMNKFSSKLSGDIGRAMAFNVGSIAANIAGGLITGKTSKTSGVTQGIGSMISGMGTGAAMGAMLGSFLPGPGTAIGAGVGAIAGGAMGLFTGITGASKERKRQKEERMQAAYEAAFAGITTNNLESLKKVKERNEQFIQDLGQWEQIKKDTKLKGSLDDLSGVAYNFYQSLMEPINKVLSDPRGKANFVGSYQNLGNLTENQFKFLTQFAGEKTSSLELLRNAVKTNMQGISDKELDSAINDYENLFGNIPTQAEFNFSQGAKFDIGDYEDQAEAIKEINSQIERLDYVAQNILTTTEDKKATEALIERLKFQRSVIGMDAKVLESSKAWQDVQKAYMKAVDDQDRMGAILGYNIEMLTQNFKVSSEEAAKLATNAGYKLTDSLLGVDEVMNLLGYSSDEMANRATAAGKILRNLMSPIENARTQREFQQKFSAAGQVLFDAGTPGMPAFATKEEAMGPAEDFIDLFFQQAVEKYQKTPSMSYDAFIAQTEKEMQAMIDAQKSLLGFEGVKNPASDPVILALEEIKRTTIGNARNIGIVEKMQYDPTLATNVMSTFKEEVANTIRNDSRLSEKLKSPTEGLAAAEGVVKRLSDNLSKVGVKLTPEDRGQLLSLAYSEMSKQLDPTNQALLGLTDAIKNIAVHIEGTIKFDQDGKVVTASINAIDGSKDKGAGTQGPIGVTPGGTAPQDTATSRLQRTLARHAMFNSGIAGNRTITSSLRNFNLGSLSSDHAIGAAYDLTGDNLGQYAQTVNDAGGFAEFHGSAGSRHLHVVPPQAGDTASPMMGQATGSASVTNNYSIQVVAKDNATAQEVAQLVMRELNARERSMKERS